MADRKITTFAAPNVADMSSMVGSFASGGQLPKRYLSPLSSVARARPGQEGRPLVSAPTIFRIAFVRNATTAYE